jgi:hypothetical protein
LQKSPSLHAELFGSAARQLSFASLQLSAQLPSPSAPGHGLPAWTVQAPAAHVSAPLQNVASLHDVPDWGVQVPGEAPLQVMQSVARPPPHALVQHTVSTQAVPPWHIVSRRHEPPGPFTASHCVVSKLQKKPLVHWLSAEQVPWQAVPLQGVAAPHGTGACDEQTPPVHAAGGTACAFGIVPEQLAATPHVVPLATGVWQTPATQVSRVHTLPSLPQLVPLATFECVQPEPGLHESLVQAFPSSQGRAVPVPAPVPHVPALHFSPTVQALLSSHEFPVSGWAKQPPGSWHAPESHWSADAEQSSALPPVHAPAWHVSPTLQVRASLQAVPLVLMGLEQTPPEQVPALWHWSSAVQTMGLPPVQVPAWQVSVCVQALPSLHEVPFVLIGLEQVPPEQVPAL